MKSVLFATTALALTATAALAADLPSRVAPPVYVPPPVAAFTWTGFEFGLHSAYTFGTNNRVFTNGVGTPRGDRRPSYLSTDKKGFSNVGAGLAYNYQFTPGAGIVVGAAVDADWVALNKNAYYVNDGLLSVYHQRLTTLGTANGRLGYAFDRLLVYGTGGFAFGDPGVGGVFSSPAGITNRYIGGNDGKLKGGYDFGGGIEYAIPEDSFFNKFAFEKMFLERIFNIRTSTILKAEYIHYDLGSETVRLGSTGIPGAGGAYSLRFHTEGNQVRAGLSYIISPTPTPVVARY